MLDPNEDQALVVISAMVRNAPPGANAYLVVGAFASTTWFLDAIVEAALIHCGDEVLVNRAARAVYAGGRTFRLVSGDAPAVSIAGVDRRSLHFAPCASARLARWVG